MYSGEEESGSNLKNIAYFQDLAYPDKKKTNPDLNCKHLKNKNVSSRADKKSVEFNRSFNL